MAGFEAHLAQAVTTLCRAWAIVRKDGKTFGFTDHDGALNFEGITFKADTGLSAVALAQSTGLSVDNTEAIGALNDASVREDEIEAGRFDDADVRSWLVNWANPDERVLQFRGTIGEIRRAGGAFQAELRGLTEALNRPQGRVFQKPCTAVLGDANCGFDVNAPGFSTEVALASVVDKRVFEWPELESFEADWFSRGRLEVLDGAAAGLWGLIKFDEIAQTRRIVLWEPLRGDVQVGDRVKLIAGCDRRFATCQAKFNNLLNFQGFPDIPGDDWMMAVPKKADVNGGGSLR